MRFSLLVILLFTRFCFADQTPAPENSKAVRAFASAGFGVGGSHLSDVTGGQDYNIRAGSGLSLTGGALVPMFVSESLNLAAQFGAGILLQADNRDQSKEASWIRFPLESILFIRNGCCFRFGAGPIYHVGNRISAKGANSSASTGVDNALGWAIATEILMGWEERHLLAIGLRYNSIKYESSSFSGDADGSALFLTATGIWF